MTAKELEKLLKRNGWAEDRQNGSHKVFVKPKHFPVVVPCHAGKDIKPGTLNAILKQAGIKK